jgi:hypothetical protein
MSKPVVRSTDLPSARTRCPAGAPTSETISKAVPVLLPRRLATLVRAQLDAAPAHPAPRSPGPRPLFPGRSPARPAAPQTLTRRLRQHGIEPRQARNAALAAWASGLPPAVLASLLGVHIQTAVNWASHTRRDWTTYIADRVSSPAPGNLTFVS